VPVILTAGQSNADGRVPLSELPDEMRDFQYCQWSYGSGDFETATGKFSPFSPRVAKPKIEESWGFDAVVYHKLESLWQRPFYVIKHTDGGTAIDPSCKSSTHGLFWSADTAFLNSTGSASHGGKSLLKAFEQQIDDCLPNLPKNYDIKVLLWHQGESDQKAADRYYENLKAVINHIRQHLVAVTGKKKYARLPVICGTYAKGSRMRSQQVVEALYKLAQEDKYFYVIDASDLPLLRDNLHFNAQAAQELGQRFFDKMLEL
jgi:lysophospholipase L1-like esterase